MIKKYRGMILSIIIYLIVAMISLRIGTVKLTFSEIVTVLFLDGGSQEQQLILFSFRIPRLLVASLVGLALSLSGEILQKITKNPIADAGILGVSSGAACGGVLYFFLQGAYQSKLSEYQFTSLMFFGLLGAIVALLFNLVLSFQHGKLSMPRFILNGIGISAGFSAIVTFLSLKINADNYAQVNNWLQGSISQVTMTKVVQLSFWVLPVTCVVLAFYPKLNLLKFSETHLDMLGFSVTFWRLTFIVFAAILISGSVLTAGTIGFVGLIVPPLTRLTFKNEGRAYLVSLGFCGMSLLVICDMIAKTVFSPNELPLNAMMGLLGIPYLGYLFYQSRKRRK